MKLVLQLAKLLCLIRMSSYQQKGPKKRFYNYNTISGWKLTNDWVLTPCYMLNQNNYNKIFTAAGLLQNWIWAIYHIDIGKQQFPSWHLLVQIQQ